MASDPSAKSKSKNHSYPRRIVDKTKDWFKSLSKSVSQQSSRVSTPTADSGSSSLVPRVRSRSAVTSNIHLSSSTNVPALQLSTSAPNLVPSVLASPTPRVANVPDDHTVPAIEAAQLQPNLKSEQGGHSQPSSPTALEVALRTLHKTAGVFPPLQSAINTLISCLELVQSADENHQGRDDLTSDLKSLNELLLRHSQELESTSMSDSVVNVVESIGEEVRKLDSKRNQGLATGIRRANADANELSQSISRIQALLRRLEVGVSLSTWSIANEHLANTRLEALSPVKLAGYNSALPEDANILRRKCTEGTRTDILSGLKSWSNDPEDAKVYWMNGMAGTGKTTIACSLSMALAERKQLAASFFCTRTLPECRDARRIVPTIAYQLARFSRPFQYELCKVLGQEPDTATKTIVTQFEELLKKPLLAIKDSMPNNIVVIIDALDECDDNHGVQTFLKEVFRFAEVLPIKFFISSRPDSGINDMILPKAAGARSILHLHEIGKSLVQADIELYLTEELEPVRASKAQIIHLARLAGNFFIYAATVVRYICPDGSNTIVNPQERLEAVLSAQSESNMQHEELDALYMTILTRVFNKKLEAKELERGRLVLWTAVCTRRPITVEILAALAGLRNENTRAILRSLHSVLYISQSSNLVSTFHASFPEFIFTRRRSQDFFCDQQNHEILLVRQCFEVMKAELRFNICKLESSFVLDKSVRDLGQRIERHISPPLLYACRYWSEHLSFAAPAKELCIILEDFLLKRLLFWMEVINLTWGVFYDASMLTRTLEGALQGTSMLERIPEGVLHGISMLKAIPDWLLAMGASSDISGLVSNATTFMRAFHSSDGSTSTPHIYISALPFFHASLPLLAGYWERTRGLVDLEGATMEQVGLPLAPGRSAGYVINSVALSPDGSLIAFGGGDDSESSAGGPGQLGILDWRHGRFVIGPFAGHDGSVGSVAFSPDGLRIVSGSDDNTVCVWNAQDGKLITGPIKGHTHWVRSVAFSPDGSRIVSGSFDWTICVWDAQDGKLVTGPIKGHTHWVRSVAFSPDGTHIVSGSNDWTICVWNALDGTLVLGPCKGHDGSVNSVAFSPDGSCIASGSGDNTICVWNAQVGGLIAGPFKGHTSFVTSVAFSSDGTHIVSGSGDNTICVWNAHDAKLVAGPRKFHIDKVNSVVFSPDSTQIISCSSDHSLRVTSLREITGPVPALDGEWDFRYHNWMVNHAGQYLFRVPKDLCGILPRPYHSWVLGPQGFLRANYDQLLLGDSWTRCYVG